MKFKHFNDVKIFVYILDPNSWRNYTLYFVLQHYFLIEKYEYINVLKCYWNDCLIVMISSKYIL